MMRLALIVAIAVPTRLIGLRVMAARNLFIGPLPPRPLRAKEQ